jgi:type 1 glutamine amidotransferase
MISKIVLLFLTLVLFDVQAQKKMNGKSTRILVFSKTAAFYHESIPQGIAAIQKLGAENKIAVDTTKDANLFNEETLKKYKAVIFLHTTGDVLNDQQQAAFQKYIRGGGAFVGVHSATDTEYEWPWYNKLVGAYFVNHPAIQQATILVVDKKHSATKTFPDKWIRTDECYNFRDINPGIHVICKLDESTYQGGTNGKDHPYSWYQEFEGGRVFYTAGGHTKESFSEPLFLKHILGGIIYVVRKK